jgi:hypothetical protein
LKILRSRPHSAASLQQQLARKGIVRSLSRCTRLFNDFAESGIVLATEFRAAHERKEKPLAAHEIPPPQHLILPIIREVLAQGNGGGQSEFQEAPNLTQAMTVEAG